MRIRSQSAIFGVITFVLLLSAFTAPEPYESDHLSADFHVGRREALRKLMPDSSVAVFFTSPIRNRSNDVDYHYHPDPNFRYLTGFTEPNAALLVLKENQRIDSVFTNEILWVQDKNPKEEAWTGRRLGPEQAREQLKIKTVLSAAGFPGTSINFKKFRKVFFIPIPTDVRDNPNDAADLYSLMQKFRLATEKNKNNDQIRLKEMMAMLRQVKQFEEMELLRKAINISNDAHIELMRALQPGMSEYHAQAIIEFEFRRHGAEYQGYPSICGSGENSCILHYSTNRRPMTKNDLIVVDAGAEYHGYTADITRTLPSNGKFTPEQAAIYNIVLEAQEAGIQASRTGNEFRAPHKAAVNVIKKRLKQLGIIEKDEDFILYFFHGTSHYLGLDVHDPGMYGVLKPGNVITVEPGIYIPEGSPCDPKWWNIGIRIEDDLLVTAGDPEILSGKVPKNIDAIEKMMAEESYLNRGKQQERGKREDSGY
ncbi:MAG: aminopeptidase P family protein [Bacteroidetes bacterium]|nr:aminopeptidase P family protein [Bacteroidota bacterium]